MFDNYYTKEPTYLEPHETKWRTEGRIVDAKYANTQNYEGMFSVTWMPITSDDYHMFLEHLRGIQKELMFMLPRDTRKEIKPLYETKRGFFYSSQFKTPQFNLEYGSHWDLKDRTATFTGHCRDLPTGEIVLQLDYVDVYEEVLPEYIPQNEPCDFDW